MIYFIASGHDGPVKIGVANDPEQRRNDLQTGNPNDLYLIHSEQGGHSEEQAFHKVFAPHRIRGEWFRREPIFNYLEDLLETTLPKTKLGLEWPCAGDCCSQCGDRLKVTEPLAVVRREGGYVEFLYICEHHHQWTCSWAAGFAKRGFDQDDRPKVAAIAPDKDHYTEKIRGIICEAGEDGISRSDIRSKLGSNAIPASRIARCLDAIKASGSVTVTVKKGEAGPGRTPEMWVAKGSATNQLRTSAAPVSLVG